MMKLSFGLLLWVFLGNCFSTAQAREHVLTTVWGTNVSAVPHPEYPRPTMVRPDFLNLNGIWDYTISFAGDTNRPLLTNRITVPFPVESILSGTKDRFISDSQQIWYRRKFIVPESWTGRQILLHFE